ncbi:diacylglycerol kinase family protein [Chloroflexota bacterium]
MDERVVAPGDGGSSGESQIFAANLAIEPEDYSPLVSANRWVSFQYAVAGWLYMLRTQKNIRIQAGATVVVVLLALWLEISTVEWAILVVVIAMEWMAEFINGAIEAAVNVASSELHPMAKVSKDVAAATVLLGAVAAVIVGLLILGPPLLARLHEWGVL